MGWPHDQVMAASSEDTLRLIEAQMEYEASEPVLASRLNVPIRPDESVILTEEMASVLTEKLIAAYVLFKKSRGLKSVDLKGITHFDFPVVGGLDDNPLSVSSSTLSSYLEDLCGSPILKVDDTSLFDGPICLAEGAFEVVRVRKKSWQRLYDIVDIALMKVISSFTSGASYEDVIAEMFFDPFISYHMDDILRINEITKHCHRCMSTSGRSFASSYESAPYRKNLVGSLVDMIGQGLEDRLMSFGWRVDGQILSFSSFDEDSHKAALLPIFGQKSIGIDPITLSKAFEILEICTPKASVQNDVVFLQCRA